MRTSPPSGRRSVTSSTSISGTATAPRFPASRAACRARGCSFTAPHHWFGPLAGHSVDCFAERSRNCASVLRRSCTPSGKLLGTFGIRIEHR